jgi:HD-GYP domain-containing protein (c-di-GMP phosphodiesterase class II)
MALADAYDAMTSDRPYRKSLGHKVALEEIQKGSGSQFVPDAVEAFLRVENTIAPKAVKP